MSKRITKADSILNGAAMRLEAARMRFHNAQSQLNAAKAVLDAQQDAYDDLKKALTPTPRKKANKPAQPELVQKELPQDEGPKCGICGNVADYQDHFKPSPNYHKFDFPKSVAGAAKKSSRKPAPAISTVSSEIETVAATAAGASGGD